MAAAGVDVGYLATHLGLPETNISGAISDPTIDLVSAILAAVATKAHEFDTLFSQKLQLEVELETSVRSAEAQRDASNETARKALKDVEEIRQKLIEEGIVTPLSLCKTFFVCRSNPLTLRQRQKDKPSRTNSSRSSPPARRRNPTSIHCARELCRSRRRTANPWP
ncbi:hypothetical protein F5Y03DRAFT_127175 [Xylaria venustula]|nr:hypothetical protein F5Y03DRAFT_127175 [Xylaria venustula]